MTDPVFKVHPDDMREVGNDYLPAVAEVFLDVAEILRDGTIEAADGMFVPDPFSQVVDRYSSLYTEIAARTAELSESILDAVEDVQNSDEEHSETLSEIQIALKNDAP